MRERRNKGEGSIQDLGNGKYKVVVTAGKGIDGKQKRRCATVVGRKAALEQLAEFRLRYTSPEQIKQEDKGQITFSAYVEKWLKFKAVGTRSNTRESYRRICNHLLPAFGGMKMRAITTEQISEYFLEKLKEGNASTSLGLHKTILASIFKSAVQADIVVKSPVVGSVRLPNRKRKVDMSLPREDQVKALLAKAKEVQGTKKFFAYLYPLCLLMVTTGLRRGEAVNLRWEWINFNSNQIAVKAQTTAEGTDQPLKSDSARRTLYIAREVLQVINEIPKISPFVFATSKRQSMSLSYLDETFKALFDAVGLKMRPHDLRHYHATTLLANGVNIKAVSQRLGHNNINTTLNLYVHYMPEVDDLASRIMGATYVL